MAFSEPIERDISWTGISDNDAILTNIIPPSNCETILASFQRESNSRWSALAALAYSEWDGFVEVASGADVAVGERRTWTMDMGGRDINPFIAKGTGGVLAVGVAQRAPEPIYRFARISVIFVRPPEVNPVIIAKDDQPDMSIEATDNMVFVDSTAVQFKTISVARVKAHMQAASAEIAKKTVKPWAT